MNFACYQNTLEYPSKSDFAVTYFYFRGERVATCSNSAEVVAARVKYPTAVTEKVVDQEGYDAAALAFEAETKRLAELFVIDLLNEYNLDDNDFTRKLYSIAYSQGHAGGYGEIAAVFSELADLDSAARKTYGQQRLVAK